ncbi:MAG: hypothetical protein RSA84_19605, partial [Acinetobacter sp.]
PAQLMGYYTLTPTISSRGSYLVCASKKTGSSLCKLIHYRYSKSSTCWLAWNLPGRDMDTSTEAAKP